MKLTLLAALLLSSATALANPHDELSAARASEQAASTRVSYYEMQTTIAERDVATARIRIDTATKARNAQRRAVAASEERAAQDRAIQARQDRDRAYEDLQAAVTKVRRLERVGKR